MNHNETEKALDEVSPWAKHFILEVSSGANKTMKI